MSSEFDQLDEILGVSFGDTVAMENVLTAVHIRTRVGKEGTLGNLLIHADVLKGLIAGLPDVIEAMRQDGADRDLLPPPSLPVPA